MTSDTIYKYFPELSETQHRQIDALGALYREWNERINVISRRDIDNLYTNHVLHSLVIARFWGELANGTTVMDLGTGGGFPGIPLAILYPNVQFHLIDRIAKKLTVAGDVARSIGLANVTLQHGDSGECHDRFDYVVSRAVMPLDKLVKACRRNVATKGRNGNTYAPGLVCLKGGDLAEESADVQLHVIEIPTDELLPGTPYLDKKLVYVPMGKK